MDNNNILFFDVETPNKTQSKICQIGYIYVKNGNIAEENSFLVNPEDRFEDSNIRIHGITPLQVQDAPIFPEIWNNLKQYFETSLIVGHNICFDLSVLEKTLSYYKLDFSPLEYVDTLPKSKQIFNLDTYRLDIVANECGYPMSHHHDALDDTKACKAIFDYIDQLGKWNETDHKLRSFNPQTLCGNLNELTTDAKTLEGILKGMECDSIINTKELEYLQKWVDNNSAKESILGYDILIECINKILEDGIVTQDELYYAISVADSVAAQNNKMYSSATLGIESLKGIIEGIESDSIINTTEMNYLLTWMNSHSELKGIYPFDKILELVSSVIEDGVITEEEKEKLHDAFQKFINPLAENQECSSNLCGKNVCLTGEFLFGSKDAVSEKIINIGGNIVTSVTRKTDIVLVGGQGSAAWSFGNYGTKVNTAVK